MNKKIPFESALSKKQAIAVLCYLPVHCLILPQLLGTLALKGYLSDGGANLLMYAIGCVYMLAFTWSFLRRDFDPLVDNFGYTVIQVCISYGLMLLCNLAVAGILAAIGKMENPNNAAIVDIAMSEYGKMAAMATFMAPLVEELMFRAGIFGLIRRKNRILAYLVSVLAFSLYHVWPYAISDSTYWIYIIQYIPVSFILCRCYEKCGSIWSSIFLHMVINGISIKAMTMLQEMM